MSPIYHRRVRTLCTDRGWPIALEDVCDVDSTDARSLETIVVRHRGSVSVDRTHEPKVQKILSSEIDGSWRRNRMPASEAHGGRFRCQSWLTAEDRKSRCRKARCRLPACLPLTNLGLTLRSDYTSHERLHLAERDCSVRAGEGHRPAPRFSVETARVVSVIERPRKRRDRSTWRSRTRPARWPTTGKRASRTEGPILPETQCLPRSLAPARRAPVHSRGRTCRRSDLPSRQPGWWNRPGTPPGTRASRMPAR